MVYVYVTTKRKSFGFCHFDALCDIKVNYFSPSKKKKKKEDKLLLRMWSHIPNLSNLIWVVTLKPKVRISSVFDTKFINK